MKTCFKCKETKPLDMFYEFPGLDRGRLNKCKECTKKDVRENRKKKLEYYREYDRKRSDRPDRVLARAQYQERMKNDENFALKTRERIVLWKNNNKIKRAAHVLIGNKIRDGSIVNPHKCEKCGSTGSIDAHHENYYKPLDVVWLCKDCHGARHREINKMKREGIDLSEFGF